MQVSQEINTSHYRIHAYDDNEVTISYPRWLNENKKPQLESKPLDAEASIFKQETLKKSFIISSDKLIRDWQIENVKLMTCDHFEQLKDFQPEILILSTCNILHRPKMSTYATLINAGIGVEFMNTGAACRTYNILMADERKVIAAFILP